MKRSIPHHVPTQNSLHAPFLFGRRPLAGRRSRHAGRLGLRAPQVGYLAAAAATAAAAASAAAAAVPGDCTLTFVVRQTRPRAVAVRSGALLALQPPTPITAIPPTAQVGLPGTSRACGLHLRCTSSWWVWARQGSSWQGSRHAPWLTQREKGTSLALPRPLSAAPLRHLSPLAHLQATAPGQNTTTSWCRPRGES